MDALEPMAAAGFGTTVFLDHFKDMPDHRQRGKVAYRLDEILLLSLLAVLAGAEGFNDIARFGQKKLALLRRFLPFVNGTPSHDHLGDILATLDAEAFRRCFVTWVGALMQTPVELIAIDGKTFRNSGNKGAKDAIHMVSAFANRRRLGFHGKDGGCNNDASSKVRRSSCLSTSRRNRFRARRGGNLSGRPRTSCSGPEQAGILPVISTLDWRFTGSGVCFKILRKKIFSRWSWPNNARGLPVSPCYQGETGRLR